MENFEVEAKGSEETENAGRKFATYLNPGDTVLLRGELGAGKTTFMKGVAYGLHVKSRVVSPSFVLVRNYKGHLLEKEVDIYHVDLYRMQNETEILGLGLEELIGQKDSLVFIEWGTKSSKIKYNWEVDFKIKGEKERLISTKRL